MNSEFILFPLFQNVHLPRNKNKECEKEQKKGKINEMVKLEWERQRIKEL